MRLAWAQASVASLEAVRCRVSSTCPTTYAALGTVRSLVIQYGGVRALLYSQSFSGNPVRWIPACAL